ncbi:MAG: hypothetical protein ACTHLA_14670 [Asticcacaulis sp.]|uniref:hypothetical protein n=1 Tax=Asticcacaulis sp. TaxID=1872648 RepID=UPI003F7C4922
MWKDAGALALILIAAYGAGYLTRALSEHAADQTRAATAQVQAAAQAQKSETRLIVVHDKAAQAAKEAHDEIAKAAADQPGCDESAVIDAWRGGLERVRQAADARDGSADGAASLSVAGSGDGADGRGSGGLFDRAGSRADELRSQTQSADRSD